MSEFDEQLNSWEKSFSSLSTHDHEIPADFSEEDLAFAQELDSLFALQEEELPPYFVQTLLDSEEPRFRPVDHGFEHKTRVRVFRRLKLHHRLFRPVFPSFRFLTSTITGRRSLVACVAMMLFFFLTVMFTAPSFASGMDILFLHGAKAGVMFVKNYPSNVHNTATTAHSTGHGDADPLSTLSLQTAQEQLHGWLLYTPQWIPDSYALTDTYLYQEQGQSWVDGPFMELDYSLFNTTPKGTGQLAIREFKLKADINVLQVVKDGAAQSIRIDQSGRAQAIYVDGQWVWRNKLFPTWVYGQRSELIYQKDGIVFWIVGDQLDGMNKDALLKIANSLQVFHLPRFMHLGSESTMNSVTVLNGDVNGPFTGDVLAIFPDDTGTSIYLSLGDSQQSSPNKPVRSGLHSH